MPVKTVNEEIYPHIWPNIEDWPICQIHQRRAEFVEEIEAFTNQRLLEKHGNRIGDLLARTIYMERIRVKEEPWKVDPPNERQFWRRLYRKLASAPVGEEHAEEAMAIYEEILQIIVHRYAEEIVATFKKGTFEFARRFLTVFFNRLLNTAAARNLKRLYSKEHRLSDKLICVGELEKIRSLVRKGTVVIVPTHFSNLDSILIGYAIDQILGLPAFSYGAGLNLYNAGYAAYFMNRLGAYRVDRRKKNPVYLETLKSMSNLALQHNVHSIFFPGGTRSRSGELEKKLKLGLLGTAVEAQRHLYQKGEDRKIFIVPLILGYHVVLEAKFLIEQHLIRTGRERYFRPGDQSYSFRRWVSFLWNFFSESSEVVLSFGKPLDVLGNFVDADGQSYDRQGRPVEVREYFLGAHGLEAHLQRENEYTKILAERIVERFHKDNVVLDSHIVAFVAFRLLMHMHPRLDLYQLLRLPEDEVEFPVYQVVHGVAQVQRRLLELEQAGKVKVADVCVGDPEKVMRRGLRKLGVYHVRKPLIINREGVLVSQDFSLLYYYHNRLLHYGLEEDLKWLKEPVQADAALEHAS